MRKNYLDNIKWMIQILVVMYHVVLMYNGFGLMGGIGKITNLTVQPYDVFLYIPFPWAMALLFLTSGMSTRFYLNRHSDIDLLKSRTIKLLLPSTVGICIFWFIQGYFNMQIIGNWADISGASKLFKYIVMILNGVGVLWFIQVLWIDSVILVLIRKIEKGRLLALGKKANTIWFAGFTLLIYGASQILNGKTFVTYRLGLYTVCFLLGYYVFSHDEVIERLKKLTPLYVLISVVLCIVFCSKYWGQNCTDPSINCSLLFGCYCWFGCLAVLSLMASIGNFSNKVTSWLSRSSYGVYLCHYMCISVIALYVVKPGLVSGEFAYLITIIGGFVGGYLLYQIILKIPVVRTLLVGAK